MEDFDWALIGALADELSQEDRRRLKSMMDGEADGECDCCCAENDPFDPPDEPHEPSDEEPYP